jgi:dihydrofolate reductase
VSNTLPKAEKGFVLMSGDIGTQINSLKQQQGKDMAVFGGAGLLTSLLNLKLVDELSISFIPVLLGSGKPMVSVLDEKVWLSFINSKRYGNGTLSVTYAVNYTQG